MPKRSRYTQDCRYENHQLCRFYRRIQRNGTYYCACECHQSQLLEKLAADRKARELFVGRASAGLFVSPPEPVGAAVWPVTTPPAEPQPELAETQLEQLAARSELAG
jgi:hypothetical protein